MKVGGNAQPEGPGAADALQLGHLGLRACPALQRLALPSQERSKKGGGSMDFVYLPSRQPAQRPARLRRGAKNPLQQSQNMVFVGHSVAHAGTIFERSQVVSDEQLDRKPASQLSR